MTNTPRIIKNEKEKKNKKQVTGAADLSLAAHGEANSSAKFNWTIWRIEMNLGRLQAAIQDDGAQIRK